MRIALTHPWCWPFVQRGGERLFAELADYLARAGHDVLTVSAGPSAKHERQANGVESNVHALPRQGLLMRLTGDQAVAYLPKASRTLRAWHPDAVHGMYHLDGVAARLARSRPYVVHVQGIARRVALSGKPVQRRLFHASIARAGSVVVVSEAARRSLREEFGVDAAVLYNGIDTRPFVRARDESARTDGPSVLFPGDPEDARKRIDVLTEALNRLAPRWPGLQLVVASRAASATVARVRKASDVPVEFLSVSSATDMPQAYARSWVTCNPAVREAFGLVFVESMATGVPAVGVDDGGVGEVVSEPRWLARPDDVVSLAAALDRALTDAGDPQTVIECQRRATAFDWSVRGPAFEMLYAELVDRERAKTQRRRPRPYSR